MVSGTVVNITSMPALSMFRRTLSRRPAYSSSVNGSGLRARMRAAGRCLGQGSGSSRRRLVTKWLPPALNS